MLSGTLETTRRTTRISFCGVFGITGQGKRRQSEGERNGVLSPLRHQLAEPDLPVDVHIIHEVRRFSP